MQYAFIILFILTLLVPCTARTLEPYTNNLKKLQVERIIDGDTFVASKIKVRLWGIDAPEKNRGLYSDSTEYLKELILNKLIQCQFIEIDSYNRYVMQCFDESGRDIASALVKQGYARDYEYFSNGHYKSEEHSAKSNKYGIWE